MDARSTLPKRERLQRNDQFRRVYDSGRRVGGELAVLYVLEQVPTVPGANRALGVVTSRRIGGAVQRNRARRLLREAYRLNKHRLKPNLQMVIVARAAIRAKSLADVQTALLELFSRGGALDPKLSRAD